MSAPQSGTIGAVIELTVVNAAGVAVDISGASTKQLIFKKPGGDILTVAADYVTDGVNGKLKYVTLAGELRYGNWRIQAYIVKAGLLNGRTKPAVFDVLRNIDE